MAFLTSRRARLAAISLTLLLQPCAAAREQPPEAGEKAVKAAFLYNFTKYVDWPASAFGGSQAAFRVCVFDDPAFRRDIESMLGGETVAGRPLRVLSPEAGGARGCHIAYFGQGELENAAQVLSGLRGFPVLTVGEGRQFLEQGGLIAFVLQENRVRFDINKGALDRAGLTVSSKLLRVARHVATGGPPQ